MRKKTLPATFAILALSVVLFEAAETRTPLSASFSESHSALLGLQSADPVALADFESQAQASYARLKNDVQPPVVFLSSPAAGAEVWGREVVVAAQAQDDLAVAAVQFKLDGVDLGVARAKPPYAVSWDAVMSLPGAHTLSAVAFDAAGNASTSPLVAVMVVSGAVAPPEAVVSAAPAVFSPSGVVLPPDELRAPQKFLSPARRDGVNDAAVFGAEAEEVSIFDLRGRKLFTRRRAGTAPLTWECRDESGRLVDSGVYVAKIRRKDTQAVYAYQSFAVVK